MTIVTAAPMRAKFRRVRDAALTYAIVRAPEATRRMPITVSCPNFTGFPQGRVSGQSSGNACCLHAPTEPRRDIHDHAGIYSQAAMIAFAPNPRIKSPLLCSVILLELLSNNAITCRELRFCPVARIRAPLRIPEPAGAYRGIRANMEQTWGCIGLDHHNRVPLGPGSERL